MAFLLSFEGKFLNDQRNGRCKEYYSNGNLSFEGEYLNDKRWNGKFYDYQGNIELELKDGTGKGKIYNNKNGKLLFEGELIGGVSNGKIKQYYDNGNLKLEGEYINGISNGKVKEYDCYGNLIFEGICLNGMSWIGRVKHYNCYGELLYESELLDGNVNKIIKK